MVKTCLSESGIDTKAHSVRVASSSTAAASSITTVDILKAADWSSERTFEKFYLIYYRPTQVKSSYAKAVLSSAEASNLHADIETEPSQM